MTTADPENPSDDGEYSWTPAVRSSAAVPDLAREMYQRFLESDYPDALGMAEHVLEIYPDDLMAQAIATQCRAALAEFEVEVLMETMPAPSATPETRRDSELPTSVSSMAAAVAAGEESTATFAVDPRGGPSGEMFQRFLASDHPVALAMAEALLAINPTDTMAIAIASECRAALKIDVSQSR